MTIRKPIAIALAAAFVATAALTTLAATSAHACPAGYKRVTIQGNSICRIDATPNVGLKAATKTPASGGQAKMK
jgi:hypothetical protein